MAKIQFNSKNTEPRKAEKSINDMSFEERMNHWNQVASEEPREVYSTGSWDAEIDTDNVNNMSSVARSLRNGPRHSPVYKNRR